MTTLVVGATGMLGSEICRRLRDKRKPVRAMVRATSDRAKVDALRHSGAEIVTGDLKDKASLREACEGVTTVISTASTTVSRQPGDSIPSVDEEGQLDLIDAAVAAGVEHFIYTSYSGNIDIDCPLHTAKRAVEMRLKESGLTYTILRPSCFMEVWLGPALGFDLAGGKVQIFGSGDRRLSWVSVHDVAKIAARCVDNPAAENQVLEIGGPEALSPNEIISRLERRTGRRFEVQRVPVEALESQWESATDPLQKSFAALMLAVGREGDEIDNRELLEVVPVQLTSVDEYAAQVMTK